MIEYKKVQQNYIKDNLTFPFTKTKIIRHKDDYKNDDKLSRTNLWNIFLIIITN